jgi:hypothetical protein
LFREWLQYEYKGVLMLVYVPANCTSVMQVADVAVNRPFKAKYTSVFNRCQIQRFLELPPDDKGSSLSNNVAAYATPCMNAMLSAWQHCSSAVNLHKSLENIGYTKVWKDAEFSMQARRRAAALGEHEEELVAELSGADSTRNAGLQPTPDPVGGSDDVGQWDVEEDEELEVLTRLLAEGLPNDQQAFFGRE